MAYNPDRIHFKTFFVAKTSLIPSEKFAAGGKVAKATLTSAAGFAAGSNQFSAERMF